MSTPRTITEAKTVNLSTLCAKLSKSAETVVSFLEEKLQKDGSYGEEAKDIACYFKSPMLFLIANKPRAAASILNYIKSKFMLPNGDFKTTQVLKSANPAYIEYWSYTNGWIIRADCRLGHTHISNLAYEYLDQYNVGESAGFLTNNIDTQNGVTDVLTTAHHGLINLEMGNIDIALSAGNYLCQTFSKQPNLKKGFYLRSDKHGELITYYPQEQAPFNFISTSEPNQLHFMIGYPAAYLAILYKKTKNENFLNAAKAYLDFSLSCNEHILQCNFSHKTAWAASLMYECTGDEKYLNVTESIANYFISKQENGMWFIEDINSSYDQSAEIACWFLEIVNNINEFKKKLDLKGQEKQEKSWAEKSIKYSIMALVAGLGVYSFCRFQKNNTTTASFDTVVDVTKKLNST